jgi:hypothetical protein
VRGPALNGEGDAQDGGPGDGKDEKSKDNCGDQCHDQSRSLFHGVDEHANTLERHDHEHQIFYG